MFPPTEIELAIAVHSLTTHREHSEAFLQGYIDTYSGNLQKALQARIYTLDIIFHVFEGFAEDNDSFCLPGPEYIQYEQNQFFF